MSNPRYSLPRRAVVFLPTDALELPESLTAADSNNRRAFKFSSSFALGVRESLVGPASAST
jgi:hypothetical protein